METIPNFETITGHYVNQLVTMKMFALSMQQNFPRQDSNPDLGGENHISDQVDYAKVTTSTV